MEIAKHITEQNTRTGDFDCTSTCPGCQQQREQHNALDHKLAVVRKHVELYGVAMTHHTKWDGGGLMLSVRLHPKDDEDTETLIVVRGLDHMLMLADLQLRMKRAEMMISAFLGPAESRHRALQCPVFSSDGHRCVLTINHDGEHLSEP